MTKTVLVTGGSGYIAGFLIRALVARGWHVNTTVRSLSRESEVRATLGVADDALTFFAADLMDDAGWAEAVAGCSHVAHVASPLPANAPKHADALIVPAREGALRALRFAHAAGVERFVLTSSVAAISYGHPRERDGRPYTEQDWTDLGARVGAYNQSKTIAERAARDWMAAHGAGMEFCSVNPSAVLGPVLSRDFSASIQLVQRLLDGSLPGTPGFGFAVVDVRDLAALHVLALETPGLDGERFVGAGAFVSMKDVAAILREGLGREARKVPRWGVPDAVIRLLAVFDRTVRQVIDELGRTRVIDSGHALARLGWQTRDVRATVLDTARSLIAQGVVSV